MSNEADLVAAYAKSQNLIPEMFAPIVGDQPLWMGADPGGYIILLEVTLTNIKVLARWTAVQGENFKRMHDCAMYIVQNGVGSMR